MVKALNTLSGGTQDSFYVSTLSASSQPQNSKAITILLQLENVQRHPRAHSLPADWLLCEASPVLLLQFPLLSPF